jgi:hypothetical protein
VDDYQARNRASWDERAGAHRSSPDYAVERFLEDEHFLSQVVRFDLPRLGDLRGLRGGPVSRAAFLQLRQPPSVTPIGGIW